jgi:hypothetical protein
MVVATDRAQCDEAFECVEAGHHLRPAPAPYGEQLPPYPGFAVATKSDWSDGHVSPVLVELYADVAPPGTALVHTSVLQVGRAGVVMGNVEWGLTEVDLAAGRWPLEIWVDAHDPSGVGRVVFVVRTSMP